MKIFFSILTVCSFAFFENFVDGAVYLSDFAALLVPFQHRNVFCNVKRDDVLSWAKTSIFAFHNFMNGEILPIANSLAMSMVMRYSCDAKRPLFSPLIILSRVKSIP